jgi:tetratricopeptide (TPR) repeat protein
MGTDKSLEDGKRAYKEGRYFDGAQILHDAVQEAEFSIEGEQQAELLLQYGRVLQKLARYQESEQYLNKAKDIYEQKKGHGSFEYSEAIYELGSLAYEQNYLEEAQRYLEEALSIRKVLYQPPHKDIAEVLNELGELNLKQGDNNVALQFLDEALEMRRQTVGEAHEDYADTLGNRCLVLLRLGQLDEAEAGFRKGLEIRKSCLPKEHPLIGNSLGNLAFVIQQQGSDEGVEEMIKHAIDIAIKSYGENSPLTAVPINNLGGYYLDKGNLIEAARHFERSLSIKEKTLGKENPGLIKPLINLAIVYKRLNRKDEARELSNRSDVLMKTKIASSHEKDIETMIFLADKLNSEKKHDEARVVLKQALDVATSESGADSLRTAQVLNFLASITQNNGDTEKAKGYFTAVLKIQKNHLGKKHPKVAETIRSISRCLLSQGQMDIAALLNQQAVAIEFAAGVEDPDITAMLTQYNQLRDTKGPKDPSVIQYMRLLSAMYNMRGKTEQAEALEQEYLQAREEQTGSDSLEFAHELMMKALTTIPIHLRFSSQDNGTTEVDEDAVKKGIALLEKAVAIQERVLGASADNDDLITSLEQLSSAYSVIKSFDQAERSGRRAVELAERAKGSNHWSLAGPLRGLKTILEKQLKNEEAAAVEQRLKDLPVATRAEGDERMRRTMQKALGSIGSMLQGLSALTENAEAESESGSDDEQAALGQLGKRDIDDSKSAEVKAQESADEVETTLPQSEEAPPLTLAESIRRKIAESKSIQKKGDDQKES